MAHLAVFVAQSVAQELWIAMPRGSDMPKADRRYLYKRNGSPTWWIKFRIPGTNEIFRGSLKTKDLREAQARRDKLLEQRKHLGEQTSYAMQLVKLREQYLLVFMNLFYLFL